MGIEFVARQQPAHRMAPAGHLVQAQGGACEGKDAALHLQLGKPGIARTHVDIGCQH
jgi:hypothetical protein